MGRPLVILRRYPGMSSRDCGLPWANRRTAWRWVSGTGSISHTGAEFAYILHHALHVLDRCPGNNAMAEIEDMSRAPSGLLKDLAHPLTQKVFAGEEGDGVEVAL